jgi:alkylation response protein AidB-like acyl-CoA dehydrogenase
MDIRFSEEQVEIARQARRFLENECPMEYVRTMLEDERGFTDQLWRGMAEMGWMSMRVPEAYGGLAMGLIDLAVVLEEMGRALLPGPYLATVLMAAEAVLEAGSGSQKERYLPGIARGETRGALALQEPDGGADPSYIQMKASPTGNGFSLSGTKLFVPDAHVADFLVVAARSREGEDPSEGISLFVVDTGARGMSVSLLPTMDATRKLCAVDFKDVQVDPEGILGKPHEGWAALRRVLQRAQVGLCAENVGGAHRAMEIAVEYAKIRVQFDQPIGAYQAVKHRCARMFEEVESSRSLLYWAAWAQDQAEPQEAALAVSAAKAYCSEVNRSVAASAIQVLGGTGFSWEHDIHLYLKRAKANEVALGDPVFHREQLALMLTDG